LRRFPSTFLVLALLAGVSGAFPQGTVETYLERIRTAREAEFDRLRQSVDDLVQRLGSARKRDLVRLHEQIAALGAEAAPLLVPHLDPGPSDAEGQGNDGKDRQAERRQRAEEVAQALIRSANPALVEDLLQLARTASPRGRALAVQVLGASPEQERALAGLRELFPTTEGELRVACVQAVARLAPQEALVAGALSDPDPHVVRAALDALSSMPHPEPMPAVLDLLSDASRAAPVLEALVRYFRAPDVKIDEDAVVALIRLARRNDLSPEARTAAVDALPYLGVSLSSPMKREIEPLLETSDTTLREATLVALTLLRDTRAKRELTRHYDDLVDDNPRWPQAYKQRGEMYLRIREYREAVDDFRTAIELHGKTSRLPGNRDLWVNLARAYVLDGKLRQASEALEDFGLTSELRDELRRDPDFAPLVEHSRYGKILE
jgi:tetratricopeptide (TPR) repeat protein